MKILVVDDHPLVREAFRGVIPGFESDVAIFEAANSTQAMQLVAVDPHLELTLLDLNLPDRYGFSVLLMRLRQIRKRMTCFPPPQTVAQ